MCQVGGWVGGGVIQKICTLHTAKFEETKSCINKSLPMESGVGGYCNEWVPPPLSTLLASFPYTHFLAFNSIWLPLVFCSLSNLYSFHLGL